MGQNRFSLRARGQPLPLKRFPWAGADPKKPSFWHPKSLRNPSANSAPHGAQSGAAGCPAEPKIRRKVEKIVSASPFESDAGKNLVSDRLKHRKRSSRASEGTVSARAEHHRKVSKTMPEGVQKRPGSVKKPSRNVSEISRKNHASKNRKMSPKELPAAPPRHLKIV